MAKTDICTSIGFMSIESLRFPFWPQRVRQIKWMTSSTPVMSNCSSSGYKYRTGKSPLISTQKT